MGSGGKFDSDDDDEPVYIQGYKLNVGKKRLAQVRSPCCWRSASLSLFLRKLAVPLDESILPKDYDFRHSNLPKLRANIIESQKLGTPL